MDIDAILAVDTVINRKTVSAVLGVREEAACGILNIRAYGLLRKRFVPEVPEIFQGFLKRFMAAGKNLISHIFDLFRRGRLIEQIIFHVA